jgi:hypothetical protein
MTSLSVRTSFEYRRSGMRNPVAVFQNFDATDKKTYAPFTLKYNRQSIHFTDSAIALEIGIEYYGRDVWLPLRNAIDSFEILGAEIHLKQSISYEFEGAKKTRAEYTPCEVARFSLLSTAVTLWLDSPIDAVRATVSPYG